jgi:hypothetical protein
VDEARLIAGEKRYRRGYFVGSRCSSRRGVTHHLRQPVLAELGDGVVGQGGAGSDGIDANTSGSVLGGPTLGQVVQRGLTGA